jgi:hypothetical protein
MKHEKDRSLHVWAAVACAAYLVSGDARTAVAWFGGGMAFVLVCAIAVAIAEVRK